MATSKIRASFRRSSIITTSSPHVPPPSSRGGRHNSPTPSDQHLITSRQTRRSSMISLAKSAITRKGIFLTQNGTNASALDPATCGLHVEPYATVNLSVTRQLAFGTPDEGEQSNGWRPSRFINQPCLTTFLALVIVGACIGGILSLRIKEDEIDKKLMEMWMSNHRTKTPLVRTSNARVSTENVFALEANAKANETLVNGTDSSLFWSKLLVTKRADS